METFNPFTKGNWLYDAPLLSGTTVVGASAAAAIGAGVGYELAGQGGILLGVEVGLGAFALYEVWKTLDQLKITDAINKAIKEGQEIGELASTVTDPLSGESIKKWIKYFRDHGLLPDHTGEDNERRILPIPINNIMLHLQTLDPQFKNEWRNHFIIHNPNQYLPTPENWPYYWGKLVSLWEEFITTNYPEYKTYKDYQTKMNAEFVAYVKNWLNPIVTQFKGNLGARMEGLRNWLIAVRWGGGAQWISKADVMLKMSLESMNNDYVRFFSDWDWILNHMHIVWAGAELNWWKKTNGGKIGGGKIKDMYLDEYRKTWDDAKDKRAWMLEQAYLNQFDLNDPWKRVAEVEGKKEHGQN